MQKKVVNFLLIFWLISHIYISFHHFTHYDDLYAPYIMDVINSYSKEKLINQIRKYAIEDQLIAKILNLNMVIELLKYLIGPFAVAKTSTFAPLQFYFTNIFNNIDAEYSVKIGLLRMPSVIFGFIYIMLTLKVIDKLSDSESIKITLLIYVITSWMLIAYTSQAENYVIGLIFIPVMILLLLRLNSYLETYKGIFFIAIIALLGLLSSHQVIWILLPFNFAILINTVILNRKILNKKIILRVLLLTVTIIIFVVLDYKIFIEHIVIKDKLNGGDTGIGWNSGVDGQYKFAGVGIIDFIIFLNNAYSDVLWSLIGFGNITDYGKAVYNIGFIVTLIAGYIKLSSIENFKIINIFYISTVILWLSSIYLGMLAFSPTRHSLIYMGFLWFYSSIGFCFILKRFKKIVYFLNILVFVIFIINFKSEFTLRKNLLITSKIFELIKSKKYGKIIAYKFTMDMSFDKHIKNNYENVWYNYEPYFTVYNSKKNENDDILFICISHKECDRKDSINLIMDIIKLNSTDYKINSKTIIENSTSVCYGNYTVNGNNSIFIHEYKKEKRDL